MTVQVMQRGRPAVHRNRQACLYSLSHPLRTQRRAEYGCGGAIAEVVDAPIALVALIALIALVIADDMAEAASVEAPAEEEVTGTVVAYALRGPLCDVMDDINEEAPTAAAEVAMVLEESVLFK